MAGKVKSDLQPESPETLAAENRAARGVRTYVSLFSSAGIGCYGFQEEEFRCIASVELLERRLKIQTYNRKCDLASGYICGDLTTAETKERVFAELDLWRRKFNVKDLDVLVATPPCQGMSVANHKKKDELKRNSLVVESIEMTRRIRPKFFIFENVRAFLNSACTDVDGEDKTIGKAIDSNLAGLYNILYRVVNFKDYGNPSSRTRTLVIGVRKDLKEATPCGLFPDRQPERSLREVIGHLPPLKKMGEISKGDIYHNFRKYAPRMKAWIAKIGEGQSAFDNVDPARIPHRIQNGTVVYNAQKNGDKYTRQCWDKVAPCIHTRNDLLASQNTVHPVDNRVFSIREVMLMMSVPESFAWSDVPFDKLNRMTAKAKAEFLKKEEMNIRQNLGEAVPTVIFRQIAAKIRQQLSKATLSGQEIRALIRKHNLTDHASLVEYIRETTCYDFAELSKIAELANAQRADNAAYYTRQDICYAIVKNLPDARNFTELNILEPAIGVGNFLPTLIRKYESVPKVHIDVVDIDSDSIEILKELVRKIEVPQNVCIDYIHADFLRHEFGRRYDIVVGNPPYKKLSKEKELLAEYKSEAFNQKTDNLFSFFIEKAMRISNTVSLIVPKSLINAPEFDETRSLMNAKRLERIIDFGEKAFKGVKIETVSFILDTRKRPGETVVESYITNEVKRHPQSYLTDDKFPSWIIYRNEAFDQVAEKMEFNIFKAYRDRAITKSVTKKAGKIRVLKSRNIGDNRIVDRPDYDCYVDNLNGLGVARYLNRPGCVLLPNLTYNPRACFLPKNCIADGSVAILTPLGHGRRITREDLAFYATKSFTEFYAIARNLGTRSLNIDNNSVFFFGKLKRRKR